MISMEDIYHHPVQQPLAFEAPDLGPLLDRELVNGLMDNVAALGLPHLTELFNWFNAAIFRLLEAEKEFGRAEQYLLTVRLCVEQAIICEISESVRRGGMVQVGRGVLKRLRPEVDLISLSRDCRWKKERFSGLLSEVVVRFLNVSIAVQAVLN